MLLLGEFGCPSNCALDLDGDGLFGVSDLVVWLGLFGTSC
jgi:hypothetical protein